MDYTEMEFLELVAGKQAIEAELKRREDVKREERRKAREGLNQIVIDNVDSYLLLCPNHQMSSCSDKRPDNARRGCARCILLEAKSDGYINDDFRPEFNFYKED